MLEEEVVVRSEMVESEEEAKDKNKLDVEVVIALEVESIQQIEIGR